MDKFPVDAPKGKVVNAFNLLGFRMVRQHQHISMERENRDGTWTPLTIPNHDRIKKTTGARLGRGQMKGRARHQLAGPSFW